jgi:outer membrane protein OmpA-like peptidoglycan-associated protein
MIMKKNIIHKVLICICFFVFGSSLNAQQVNTMYFMDNVPYRNKLNPAFQPISNFYLGFPVLGYSQFNIGNNSLTIKDIIYKDPTNPNAKPILFLNPNGSVQDFYNVLRNNTMVRTDVNLNLLSFGFRTGKAYWNFSLIERIDGQVTIPKDLMSIALNGLTDAYDIKNLGADFSVYTEAGLGYSRKINDMWSYGVKLKFLYGTANVSMKNNNLNLKTGIDSLVIRGNGGVNVSSPAVINGLDLPSKMPNVSTMLKPSGVGGGIDLGVTYNPIKNLTLSVAVVDLGMISWSNNVKKYSYNVNYKYTGAKVNSLNVDTIKKGILDDLKNSYTIDSTQKSYTTYTSPKINIGAEYGFFDSRLSVGLLSRTMIHRSNLYEELTASVNFKPIDWFNISTSYSILNGRASNIGAGIGLRTGFLHWFLTTDYVPLRYAKTGINLGSLGNLSLPYNTKGFNLAFGTTIVFGNRKDADKDGVVDRKDICPGTPFGVVVDKKGCPIDSDGDGVPDYLDKCPNTPLEAFSSINQDGCPIDSDGDGVPDYLDKCPNTPSKAYGFIDTFGCELDTDKDGVSDYKDKCANTPAGAKVDSVGCPLDTDGDGVPDYKDKCPNTPVEAWNMVDSLGCPLDKDMDGVPDYLDKCPNTPAEARGFIDKNGCPIDTDGDGVPDYLDKCPDTPVAARGTIDEKGCPRDTDGDGVLDYLDNCPKIAGTVENKGCPEVKKEVKKLFQKALQGIQFETGKYIIKPVSFKILNDVAAALISNPSYLVEVQGHTDNVGKPEANLLLSENRAKAVKDYLINKGVGANRVTSHGYGDTKPVASNKTKAGKAINRRVEFVVTFEQIVTE